MDEIDRRLANSVGISLQEASQNMRQAHALSASDPIPTMRERLRHLRQEEETYNPITERRRMIEAALADDTPTYRR